MPGRQPEPKHFELVVFDCNGVLVDSEVIAVRADQRALPELVAAGRPG